MSGVVKDNQGAVVPNAKVTITNQDQGTSRDVASAGEGTFFVSPLPPATYTVTVESPGFKRFERKEIKLFANDRLSLGDITLEIGGVNETVTVEAAAVQLQTESGERSGVITGSQTVNLALNGRNYLDLVKTVPGIVSNFNGQVAGPGGIGDIFANGQRGNQNNLTLDGVANMDTGSNGTQHTSLNVDAVAEFKVITNSQPAEFGRSAGAAINIVTKSGTRDFHGTGYWFHRHEGLNANNWRNNRDDLARKFYRYNYQGYNIGGPVYIPNKFNKDKNKLFFFWAQEWQEQLVPNNTRFVTVPTAAERAGDFSASHEANGSLVTIKDPLTGAPFPGNRIPSNRWNPEGAKILNWFPAPNVSGTDYNYQSQVSSSYPRRQMMGRIDWNMSDQWKVFFRVIRDKDDQTMPYGQWNGNYNIPFGPMHFGQPGVSAIANLTTIISPTLTNEFIFGPSRNHLDITPVNDAFDRTKAGFAFQMPFPNADPLNLVQNFRFGGVPNEPLHDVDGFRGTPFINTNNTFDFTDNVSWVVGGHQLKAGFYIQRSRKDQTAFTSVNGNIWFDRDANNPGDTNWAFSNALLGNFQRLQQSNIVRNGRYRYTNTEWYVQDNFKPLSNLSVNYGMRFYLIQPQYDAALQTSSFNATLFDPAQSTLLYQKAVGPGGTSVARNPVTGETAPGALVGALVPGVGALNNGLYVNGMAQAGVNGYPRGLIQSRGVQYAPRVGIAWSPLGNQKLVIRAGGGIFYDRFEGNPVFDMLPNPPSTASPTFYYGNVSNVASTPGVLFPQDVRGFSFDGHIPTTYNYNFGVQHEMPGRILLDVAYAGSLARHQLYIMNVNAAPFGSAWLPQNQDPTVSGGPRFDGTTTLPVNFYRPYLGYGNNNITAFGASSNYNSLQVSANRRLTSNLQFGVAYTWSKVLGVASGNGDSLNPINFKVANYGPLTFDRTHYAVINYIYTLPKLSRDRFWLARAILSDWTVSGITTFTTGQPDDITYSVAGVSSAELNRRITGSETFGPRPVVTGNPNVGRGSHSPDAWINTAVFRPAAKGSLGMDSAPRIVRRPGINNWDLSVFKDFPFSEGGRRVELRCEMFNAFNHTQFSDFNRSITFDAAGNVSNLPTGVGGTGGTYGFGAITAARDPRIIQLAAKIYF